LEQSEHFMEVEPGS